MQPRDGLCVCVCDAPRGTGLILSGSMILLSTPRRLRAPTRAGSMRNVNKQFAKYTFDDRGGKVPAGGVLVVGGVNRHPRPRRLNGWSLRGTHMAERDRWQVRLAFRSYAGAMAAGIRPSEGRHVSSGYI